MNKLKASFKQFTQQFLESEDERPANPQNTNTSSPTLAHISWPPSLLSEPEIIGEIKDISGRRYPRDIGRSFQLGSFTYYMFGDTFCFNSSDDFVGVTNNCVALVPSLSRPTQSQWLQSSSGGIQGKIPEFVPFSSEEKAFGEDHSAKGENKRFVNWVFGGVIEIPGSNPPSAWLFYDTVEIHGAVPVQLHGMGVARATVVNEETGELSCERVGEFPLFDPKGPAFGNLSNISAPDGYTYLLGGLGLDNYMARIRTDASFTDVGNYEFLAKGQHWVKEYQEPYGPFGGLAHDVLHGQGQGAIVYAPELAPEGKDFVWFGNSKFPTSELWIGCAETPEGPWNLACLGVMPEIGTGDEMGKGKRYTMYPHLWGSKAIDGEGEADRGVEMLVTWSDDATMGGKVVAALVKLAAQ